MSERTIRTGPATATVGGAHARPWQEVAAGLGVDPHRGLGPGEARRRLATCGANRLPPPRRDGLAARAVRGLREPMTILLLAAAAISGAVLGERLDAAAIVTIVALNLTIGLVEEGRAARALAAVGELQTPSARVRRRGEVTPVDAAGLVPGDVVLLSGGDRVPADLRLVETDGLEVDESTLTGESLTAAKSAGAVAEEAAPLGDRAGMAYAGTLVMAGRGAGVVTATGDGTVLGGIARTLRATPQATPLQQELAHLTGRLGLVAVLIAAGVFGLSLLRAAGGLEEAFLAAVALAVAAVPEGLATVTLVALALGVRRMAGRRALIRRLPAVETLGAVTVMVVDKTGTLTENRMRAEAIACAGGDFADPDSVPAALRAEVEAVVALCSDATLQPETGDATDLALLALAGPDRARALRSERPRLAELAFDSERKRMTVVNAEAGGATLRCKGAPEAVLPACDALLDPGGHPRPLDEAGRQRLLAQVAAAAAGGMRVLVLARRRLEGPHGPVGGRDGAPGREALAELERQGLELVALAGLRDAVRPQAATSVAQARAAGVRLIMATGDHPGTAAAVAVRAGLAPRAAPALTGTDLRRSGLPADPLAVAVYARLDPDQKLDLVAALQARGEVVGMTGDGVNDAPALRRADIGVALGARGSDVAREAADMVVTDDDLGTIVGAVHEGRGIYDNIRKVVDYLVAGNLSEVAVVVAALLAVPALGVPLLPLQLLWVNLLTDGLPALALGVDPVDEALMRRPPRSRRTRLLSAARLARLGLRAAVMALASMGALLVALGPLAHGPDRARTVLFTTLVAAHLLWAFAARLPAGPRGRQAPEAGPAGAVVRWFGTPWLVAAVAAGLAGQVAVVAWPPAQAVFRTVALAPIDWALVLACAGLASAILVALPRGGR